jgi:hypothetical protein
MKIVIIILFLILACGIVIQKYYENFTILGMYSPYDMSWYTKMKREQLEEQEGKRKVIPMWKPPIIKPIYRPIIRSTQPPNFTRFNQRRSHR